MDLSTLFGSPTATPTQQQGLLGMFGGGATTPQQAQLMGLLNQQPKQLDEPAPQLGKYRQMPGSGQTPLPQFAPQIQAGIPNFNALALLRARLGMAQQQQPQGNPMMGQQMPGRGY